MLPQKNKKIWLSYKPKKEELPLYESLFISDKNKDRQHIERDEASDILSRSLLPKNVMNMILRMVTGNESGHLNINQFYTAIRLIQLRQNCKIVRDHTLTTPDDVSLNPPYFENINKLDLETKQLPQMKDLMKINADNLANKNCNDERLRCRSGCYKCKAMEKEIERLREELCRTISALNETKPKKITLKELPITSEGSKSLGNARVGIELLEIFPTKSGLNEKVENVRERHTKREEYTNKANFHRFRDSLSRKQQQLQDNNVSQNNDHVDKHRIQSNTRNSDMNNIYEGRKNIRLSKNMSLERTAVSNQSGEPEPQKAPMRRRSHEKAKKEMDDFFERFYNDSCPITTRAPTRRRSTISKRLGFNKRTVRRVKSFE